jgi:hypothetical protein
MKISIVSHKCGQVLAKGSLSSHPLRLLRSAAPSVDLSSVLYRRWCLLFASVLPLAPFVFLLRKPATLALLQALAPYPLALGLCVSVKY